MQHGAVNAPRFGSTGLNMAGVKVTLDRPFTVEGVVQVLDQSLSDAIPGSCNLHVKVSLSKMLNPKSLRMLMSRGHPEG